MADLPTSTDLNDLIVYAGSLGMPWSIEKSPEDGVYRAKVWYKGAYASNWRKEREHSSPGEALLFAIREVQTILSKHGVVV